MNSPPSTIDWTVTTRPETWDLQWIGATTDERVRLYTWLNQCHGNQVVQVTKPGEHRGAIADAVITDQRDAVLVIRTADCAPVLFVGKRSDGTDLLGLAHAGWKGLTNGVLTSTANALRNIGAETVEAWLGACIGPECYEFGTDALEPLKQQFGEKICAQTMWGTPALNMPAGVSAALAVANVIDRGLLPDWSCTACDAGRRYSHRARSETGRMALIASLR